MMKMSRVCEKHDGYEQGCAICELEQERDRYKSGLEEICVLHKNTDIPVLDNRGMIILAKYVLNLDNAYLIKKGIYY